jgi:hypothetical protein
MMLYARCLRVVLVRDRGSDLSNGGFCVLKHVEVNVRLKEQLERRRGPSEFDVIVQDRIQVADILGSCFLIVITTQASRSLAEGCYQPDSSLNASILDPLIHDGVSKNKVGLDATF